MPYSRDGCLTKKFFTQPKKDSLLPRQMLGHHALTFTHFAQWRIPD
ncbi:hypothetical protein CBM2585_B140031 [Cupriavidus taiwanensis]|nr:hypothetical protein CBM2585_B140031 [Cupriavidus taiwanensis]